MSSLRMIGNTFLSWALAGVMMAGSAVATADELDTIGYAQGHQTFGLSIGGSPGAGGFSGTWNSADITFWCVELTQYFGFGGDYTDYTTSHPDNAMFTMLGQLFTEAYADALKDEAHSAAFQLAIWEIVYDSGNLNLAGGGFEVTNANGHQGTVDIAQGWLNNLGKYSDNYDLVLLSSSTHQDFVTFGRPFIQRFQAPEPASLALIGAALLALALVRSRTRRARLG